MRSGPPRAGCERGRRWGCPRPGGLLRVGANVALEATDCYCLTRNKQGDWQLDTALSCISGFSLSCGS